MRQIDITDYIVSLPNPKAGEECKDGSVEPAVVDLPYHVKESVVELLFARDNRLSGTELLARDKLAHKINDCPDGSVLLEEDEWNKLVTAINTVTGLGRTDVELVHRILEAEKVEVEVKPKEGQK